MDASAGGCLSYFLLVTDHEQFEVGMTTSLHAELACLQIPLHDMYLRGDSIANGRPQERGSHRHRKADSKNVGTKIGIYFF